MISINGHNIDSIVIGNKNVIKVQDASNLKVMWEKNKPKPIEYFYIHNTSDSQNNVEISTVKTGTPPSGTYATSVWYRIEDSKWASIQLVAGDTITITLEPEETIYFSNNSGKWNTETLSSSWVTSFNCSEECIVGGNINTLLDSTNPDSVSLPKNCFRELFNGNIYIVDATKLYLPSTTLAEGCYYAMFENCERLTTPPEIKATTLANYCCQNMFTSCTSLNSAPKLEATTLAPGCYYQMFHGCESLETSPELPAKTLANRCYEEMFMYCTSLNEITIYADDISASQCIENWVYNVAPEGNFYNLGSAEYENGQNGIPDGWTEIKQ